MKLKSISIVNFRSIKDVELEIKEINNMNCHIFLGINETGKSNILKAISLLDRSRPFQYEKDCEKSAKKNLEPVRITYNFLLEDAERSTLDSEMQKLNVPKDFSSNVKYFKKVLLFANNSTRSEQWSPVYDYAPFSSYYINPSGVLEKKGSSSTPELTEEQFDQYFSTKFSSVLDKLLPKTIYWKYSPQFLITQPISLDAFRSAPEQQSIPLKNIFYLAGYDSPDKLVKSVERARSDPDERSQLEDELSKSVTKHINDIWPEHKIDFGIRIEGNQCSVNVSDKDNASKKFNMEDRSDGFKQFVSILLTLSAQTRSKELTNAIILLDEPEMSLHPSSVLYLMDELLKISQKNIVLASTHSIFLVDKKNLERHIKVHKQDGLTQIDRIKSNDPFRDEVIYRALGTSLYEIIEPYVLIFEGSTDKEMYDAFSKRFQDEKSLRNLQTIYASGVGDLPKYAKFFNQKTVTAIILVDSDKAGRDTKQKIISDSPAFSDTVFELSDINKEIIYGSTLEDLLPSEVIEASFERTFGEKLRLNSDKPVIEQIKESLGRKSLLSDEALEKFKLATLRIVLQNLSTRKDDFKQKYPLYTAFVTALNAKIAGIQRAKR